MCAGGIIAVMVCNECYRMYKESKVLHEAHSSTKLCSRNTNSCDFRKKHELFIVIITERMKNALWEGISIT